MNTLDNYNLPNKPGIYKITNIVNDKFYIGCSLNINNRIKKHINEVNSGNHHNKYLSNSIKKYKLKNFKIEVLELFNEIEFEKLNNKEIYYIKKYNTLEKGYNLKIDNSSYLKKLNKSKKHIQNNINKQSINVLAFNRFTGELKYEFSSIAEASKFFNTSSSNISRICKGKLNYIKNHTFCYKKEYDKDKDYSKPFYWSKNKKKSKLHLNKIKKANQNRLGKDIYKYDLNWNLIKKYNSRAEAERENNFKKESLRRKAGLKTPWRGFYWMYNKI